MNDEFTPDLLTTANSAFQKLGRNVFFLQQIEGKMKVLLAHCDVSGTASELEDLMQQLRQPASKKTLGALVTEFFERLYTEVSDPKRPEGSEVPWFASGFRFCEPKEGLERQMDMLSSLVFERNQLIHHELPFLDLNSEASCGQFAARLDDQFKQIVSVDAILSRHIKNINAMREALPDIVRQVSENHRVQSQVDSSR